MGQDDGDTTWTKGIAPITLCLLLLQKSSMNDLSTRPLCVGDFVA